MIDRQALLKDLQGLLRTLEADLLERSESSEVPEVRAALKEEHEKAKEAQRTAQNYEDWRSDYVTQIAAAWVLSCVFARFLEDNRLVDPPKIAGPGERLSRARDEHQVYFTAHPTETDREYLLAVFDELAGLPGGGVFSHQLSVISLTDSNTDNCQLTTDNSRNWLSGDAAGELLRFFRRIDADTGVLIHDFTDPEWDTRFLGDLYQDLSEAARKKYALLQTPEFVEEFILDRTLDPAIDEFGLEGFRMIDPACGSGHFLLGAFRRLLERWQRQEPATNVRELVQRALGSVHGVDVNPYAVAISRFRLLLMALKGSEITRLADAPAFEFNLACGDSLYHGRETQMMLKGVETDESHYFRAEDAQELRRMLREGTYHCVVANPPYITPKDRAARDAYRRLYSSCHRQYSLAVPFMQRIFGLAVRRGTNGGGAGCTGQITANSFMKREFGKKLIEEFFKTVDLTHVIDTSLAHLPGHGTPTVILFGRNRPPIADSVRAVMGIKREDNTPVEPAKGLVWSAILAQVDDVGSQSEFVSVRDTHRDVFQHHPWSLGGGGAADLKTSLEDCSQRRLRDVCHEIGFGAVTRDDDAFLVTRRVGLRHSIPREQIRVLGSGDEVRDWCLRDPTLAIWPYDPETLEPCRPEPLVRFLWRYRTQLCGRVAYGHSQLERGLEWYEYSMFFKDRFRTPLSIAFAFVATHNHFILDRGDNVFKRTAPVIKLPPDSDVEDHLALLNLLNSSSGCFWMKQTFYDRGGGGIGGGVAAEGWERFYEHDGTKTKSFPVLEHVPFDLAERLDLLAHQLLETSAGDSIACYVQKQSNSSLSEVVAETKTRSARLLGEMIRLQEDLDWQCYRLYGLLDDDLTYDAESFPIQLGQRAFEIVLARKMARGEVQTTWFERHGSTPITELPSDWPDDYRQLVDWRIEVIEGNPQIALIEQPEYKRRWNTEPWDSQVEKALRSWLLDRLEGYFDFDFRMKGVVSYFAQEATPEVAFSDPEKKPQFRVEAAAVVAQIPVCLISTARIADWAARDPRFTEAAEVHRDDSAFNVQNLVEELVAAESVPLLPVLRYKPAGLRKREQWEKTWELQRAEDVLSCQLSVISCQLEEATDEAEKQRLRAEHEKLTTEHCQLTTSIPVPPKYMSSDFICSGGARYWSLRGKLDVPKERWVSFPHCEGEDGTLMIAWAGYDHLQLARAISAYYVDVQERLGGRDDPRLVPLLACLIELLPWLKQWHNEIDPHFNMAMGDYFEGFIQEEARQMGKTVDEVKSWEPPKKAARRRKKAKP